MKRKQGLLFFISSCIPGCGQMHQGYMRRGMSLLTVFCGLFAIAVFLNIGALTVLMVPVWLYAFFDSYNLRTRLDEAHISSFTLQGSTPKEKRAKLVKAFNAGVASVFLISLKAGGTGLNLTAADIVIHFDPWWNQAAQDQATDRAHRIGQQAHVQVYKLIAKDTIEEKILELQEKKAALMDTISGAEDGGILNMSKEDLLALLTETA